MSLTDADLADDEANYELTRYEQGAHPNEFLEERTYRGCGCKAVKVATIAGWQRVAAPACQDPMHQQRPQR